VASEDSAREKKLCQDNDGFNFVGGCRLSLRATIETESQSNHGARRTSEELE
jgi:hypothetical protein